MKKASRIALSAAAMTAAIIYAVAPEPADEKKKAPFMGQNIAHRGLHTPDRSVPENTLEAFRLAVENGYGIEFDVHLTADERLVVFHDDTVDRLTEYEGSVESYTYDELRNMGIAGTENVMPLFSEVLDLVNGRAPMIIELKTGHDDVILCSKVRDALRDYEGPYCIESFNPYIVGWWRRNAPDVLRGQLSCRSESLGKKLSFAERFALGNLLTNCVSRPNFVAYGLCENKPIMVKLCEALGAMKVCWTSHSRQNEAGNDTVIFEFYRPDVRFK